MEALDWSSSCDVVSTGVLLWAVSDYECPGLLLTPYATGRVVPACDVRTFGIHKRSHPEYG